MIADLNWEAIDAAVASTIGEGLLDDETGDVSENGHWYGLLRGGFDATQLAWFPELGLSAEDVAFLHDMPGAIIFEDSSGFKGVEFVDTAEDLDRSWEEIEKEIAEFNAESDAEFYGEDEV